MSSSPIYEQVSANLPGKPFRASGLYRLAGRMKNGRFIRANAGTLKTYAQWRALEARPSLRTTGLAQEHPVMRWRCAMCLSYLKAELDATGQYPPCPQCGFSEERGPSHVPADDKFPAVYAAAPPDTLARVVAYQAARAAGVPPPGPQPVQMIRLGPPPTPFVATPMGCTLDRVLALQRQLGQRPADPYKPLLLMDTTTPCARCRKSPALCQCVPLPPDTLGQAAKRAAIRVQQEQAAAMIAYPQLRKGTL